MEDNMQRVFLLRCKHCGKEITGPDEFRTMQGLRAHLKGCAKRKKPIEIKGLSRDIKVWCRAYNARREIEEFSARILRDIKPEFAEPMIVAYLTRLATEMKWRKRDFRFEFVSKGPSPDK